MDITITDRSNLHILWVSNYYDLPLEGLCRHYGKICRFETDYETEVTTIYSLEPIEKARWIFRKLAFELCVGTHWTYKDGKHREQSYGSRRPKWFWSMICRMYFRFNGYKAKIKLLGKSNGND